MSHRPSRTVAEGLHSQVEFSLNQPQEGSPETQFRRTPDISFHRKFYNRKLRFPDGREHEIWSFEGDNSGRSLPGPLIRVTEGQVVHVTVQPSKGPHTIHLHGIEPDPRNDGVGHTSFEVTGDYTYQFRPSVGRENDPNVGSAGTYFYHCHVNTALHVQMGMFGPLIIDPKEGGRGKAFIDDPEGYDVRAETLLVPYAVDPRWHSLNHAAGLNGEDVGLNRFNPASFFLLGGNLAATPRRDAVNTVSEILATEHGRAPGLLRINNATYFPTRIEFHDGMQVEMISHDGRPLRNTVTGDPVAAVTNQVAFGAAERYDLRLLTPAGSAVGKTFKVTVNLEDWITPAGAPRVIHTAETKVRVIGPA